MRLKLGLLAIACSLLAACAGRTTATPIASSAPALTYPERVELVVACIEEHGFNASSYEGFGIRIDYSGEEQEELATKVEGDCWEQIDRRVPPPPPLSLESRYEYMVEVADCLRGLGHDVPDAPTLDAYVDQASADPPPADLWDPYAIVGRRGVDIWAIQRDECPPYPWAR